MAGPCYQSSMLRESYSDKKLDSSPRRGAIAARVESESLLDKALDLIHPRRGFIEDVS